MVRAILRAIADLIRFHGIEILFALVVIGVIATIAYLVWTNLGGKGPPPDNR